MHSFIIVLFKWEKYFFFLNHTKCRFCRSKSFGASVSYCLFIVFFFFVRKSIDYRSVCSFELPATADTTLRKLHSIHLRIRETVESFSNCGIVNEIIVNFKVKQCILNSPFTSSHYNWIKIGRNKWGNIISNYKYPIIINNIKK